MSEGTLQGSIRIDTSSVEEAVKQVSNLRSTLYKYARANSVLGDFNKTFNGHIKSYRVLSTAADEFAAAQQRADTIITRAATAVENFNHKVRTSNLTVEQQRDLILAANSNLNGYAQAVNRGVLGGQELSAIQTQLNSGLSELNRQFKDYSTSVANSEKAEKMLNQAMLSSELQLEKLTGEVNASVISDMDKKAMIDKLTSTHREYSSQLKSAAGDVSAITRVQNNYKRKVIEINSELKALNTTAKNSQISAFADEFRNLTSSVVVALGPLSGVASRLIALQGIFNRNAIGLAALLSSVTGLSVVLNSAFNNAIKAETSFNRLESQLEILGGKAKFTADELSQMGDRLADATLGGTDEFREAASALLQFGDIGRDSFERVITTAYGMTSVLGGSLKESLRKVAKSMQDPIKAFEQLRESGVQFSLEAKKQISILSAQGKKQEAQALILDELSGYYNAAMKEGSGMSGAMDAVSVAFQYATENIYKNSDAYKNLTQNTFNFAKSIREVVDSPYFTLIKDLADGALNALSSAVDTAKGSFDYLVAVMAAVFAKYAVSGTIRILSLSAAFGRSLVPSVDLSTEAIKKNNLVMKLGIDTSSKMAKSIGVLGVAFKALPLVGFVAGLWSAIDAISEFREAAKNTSKDFDISSVLTEGIDEIIAKTDDLTQVEKDAAAQRISNIKNSYTSINKQIKALEKQRSDIVKDNLDSIEGAEEKYAFYSEMLQDKLANGMLITSEMGKNLTKVIEKLETKNGEYSESLSKIDTRLAELKGQLEGITASAKEFSKDPLGMSKLENSARTLMEAKVALTALGETYRTNSTKVEQYGLDLKEVDRVMSVMSSREFMKFFTAEDVRNISQVRAEITSLIDKATGNTGSSDGLISGLDDAIYKADRLYVELNAIGDVFDSGALSKFDQGMEFNKAFDEILAMSEEAKVKLRDRLGAISTDVNDLFEAFKNQKTGYDTFVLSMQRQVQYTNEVKSAMDGLAPAVNQVSLKYALLASKALAVNDEFAAANFIKKMKMEIDEINRLGDEASKGTSPFAALFMSPDEVREKANAQMQAIRDANGLAVTETNAAIDSIKESLNGLLIISDIGYAVRGLSDVFATSLETMKEAGREGTRSYKAMARANIIVSQSMAIAAAWANAMKYGGHPAVATGLAAAQTALISATMVQQLANVNSAAYATGGYVSGDGTATSDSIPAMLSNGEYVINAAAVRKLGIPTLNALNNGVKPIAKADGGPVGLIPGMGKGSSGSGDVSVQIIDQSSGSGKQYETSEELGPDGVRRIKVLIRDTVRELANKGEFDKTMSNNFAVQRQSKRR